MANRASPFVVEESKLIVFTSTSRTIFQGIIWPIVIVGIISNIGVVLRILIADRNKQSVLNPFYRSALLSLAFSDLLLLASSGLNTLSSISKSTILWTLPDWCCSFIPYFQTVAALVTSLTLAGVAIDRYAAMRSTYPLSKGLKWYWAIAFVAAIWIISLAASYRVIGVYHTEPLVVVNNSTYYVGSLCLTSQRAEAAITYTALYAAIFIPLGTVFILVHVLLACNIWRRRSPGTNKAQDHSSQFSNDNSTASTNLGKSRQVASKKIGPTPSHVARKRRTLRVILVLIIIFTTCRLPHWSFLIYKLHALSTGEYGWYIQLVLTSMSFFNAAVHPFLYAFLNEALSLVTWVRGWFKRTRTSSKVSATVQPITNNATATMISPKVPRGPYYSP